MSRQIKPHSFAGTASPAPAAAPSRSDRFLARVDGHLSILESDAKRRAFLTQQIVGWEERYARFINSEGESEAVIDPRDPPQAADFVLTIAGLEVRRAKYARVAEMVS